MIINSNNIIESFELGTVSTVETYFFNTNNHTYKVCGDGSSVVRFPRSLFNSLFGVGFDELMSVLHESNFYSLTDNGGYGFYYENDFEYLISKGVWGSSFKVVREYEFGFS